MTPAQKRAMEHLANRAGWSPIGKRPLGTKTVAVLVSNGWVETRSRRTSDIRGSGYVPGQWSVAYEDLNEVKITPKGERAIVAQGIREPFEAALAKAQGLVEHWQDSPEDHAKWTGKVEHLTELLSN